MSLPPNVVILQRPADLVPVAQQLQATAREKHIESLPLYARTPEEAMARYGPRAAELAADPHGRVLLIPREGFFSVVLSIDTYGEKPCWHLSIAQASQTGPDRAPDSIAHMIAKAILPGPFTEGPPEGAFKKVRHFRTPFVTS